jgi:hypothetical protein
MAEKTLLGGNHGATMVVNNCSAAQMGSPGELGSARA